MKAFFFNDRVQSKKAEELERKVKVLEKAKGGPAPGGLVKELESLTKREQDLQSRLDRMEDENLRLRCDLSLNSPRFRECRELLQKVLRATDEGGKTADHLTRCVVIFLVSPSDSFT